MGNQSSQLLGACEEGDVLKVKLLLKAGADVNEVNKYLETPLHIACKKGNVAIVNSLLHAGVNVNRANKYSETPLHIACKKENVAIVNLLMNAGADTKNVNMYSETPLHIARKKGNVAIVESLLHAGAVQRLKTHGGEATRNLETQAGHEKLFKRSLNSNVNEPGPSHSNNVMPDDLNSKIKEVNSQLKGLTLEYSTVEKQSHFFADELNLANVKVVSLREQNEDYDNFVEAITTRDHRLLEAVKQNNMEEARELIVSGANINAGDQNGYRPLHLAILNRNMTMFAYLIGQAPNLNTVDRWRQTPLHLAVHGNQHDMVLLLLQSGCNVNARDANGHSPIYIANERNLVDIGRLLAEYRANLSELTSRFRMLVAPSTSEEIAANFRAFEVPPSAAGTRTCDICVTRPVNCFSQVCGHIYCEGCIRQWLLQTEECPFCKQRTTTENLRPLYYDVGK